jgi:long-chain acyl-CoA synthetase
VTLDEEFDEFISACRRAEVVAVQGNPRGLGSIGYTSGTTGHPKGAMQTLESVLLNCAYAATMHGKTSDDVVLTALPAAHVYGNVTINGTFLAGGTVVLMERFDPVRALDLMTRHRVSVFEGVPAMYSMLLSAPEIDDIDLSFLRVSTVGGQTISPSVIANWEHKTRARLLELWGMTEVSGMGTTHPVHAPPVPGSIGTALPGVEIAIAAIDGGDQPVPVGEHGELMIRGPVVMLGYLGRPAATAEVLGSDGWLRTGDVAYIVARPGTHPSPEQVQQFCSAQLAPYKRPRDIVFVAELPTTSSGKLMCRKLGEHRARLG